MSEVPLQCSVRFRTNVWHIYVSQSQIQSNLFFQVNVLASSKGAPSSLGSGCGTVKQLMQKCEATEECGVQVWGVEIGGKL